jgi:hypothetical protein
MDLGVTDPTRASWYEVRPLSWFPGGESSTKSVTEKIIESPKFDITAPGDPVLDQESFVVSVECLPQPKGSETTIANGTQWSRYALDGVAFDSGGIVDNTFGGKLSVGVTLSSSTTWSSAAVNRWTFNESRLLCGLPAGRPTSYYTANKSSVAIF